MSSFSRRTIIGALSGALFLAACISDRGGFSAAERIDANVDQALNYLYATQPEMTELRDKAAGILVIPRVNKAGLVFGGSFGRGALRIGSVTVDYYSVASATVGFQIGGQQYSHALFFMTEEALRDFRSSSGIAAGSEVEFVVSRDAQSVLSETTLALSPVVTVIFGQAGLSAGATVKGIKYTRIAP